MFVQSYFSPAYKVTLGTLTEEVWDWIKINLDGVCCNQLLSGLDSVGFFFLLSASSLHHESETYE